MNFSRTGCHYIEMSASDLILLLACVHIHPSSRSELSETETWLCVSLPACTTVLNFIIKPSPPHTHYSTRNTPLSINYVIIDIYSFRFVLLFWHFTSFIVPIVIAFEKHLMKSSSVFQHNLCILYSSFYINIYRKCKGSRWIEWYCNEVLSNFIKRRKKKTLVISFQF